MPHSSGRIPESVRDRILLEDDALAAELRAMTDAHTDLLAMRISEQVSRSRPWSFVNHLSRLVVDPERFPDDREVMNRVGMGAVYTRTSTGTRLRTEDRAHRSDLIATLFNPYSKALADLVDDRLATTGHAVILDLHSFPKAPLPYELYPDDERPVTCLGGDDRHTPAKLLDAAREAFAPLGSVATNQPFRGTYVPLRHSARCGVLALHRRLGASWAGPTVGRCSVCGAGDLQCDHMPGRWYDGLHCHRIVYEADLRDISLAPFPDDPRTYRMEVARTPREIRAARGRPLRHGEVPLCTHCSEGCDGADRGPREEDVDQSLWPVSAHGGEGGA